MFILIFSFSWCHNIMWKKKIQQISILNNINFFFLLPKYHPLFTNPNQSLWRFHYARRHEIFTESCNVEITKVKSLSIELLTCLAVSSIESSSFAVTFKSGLRWYLGTRAFVQTRLRSRAYVVTSSCKKKLSNTHTSVETIKNRMCE